MSRELTNFLVSELSQFDRYRSPRHILIDRYETRDLNFAAPVQSGFRDKIRKMKQIICDHHLALRL